MSILDLKNDETIRIDSFKETVPEPLFLCEKDKTFFKKMFNRKFLLYFKIKRKDPREKRKLIILACTPILAICVLLIGIFLSAKKNENSFSFLKGNNREIINLNSDDENELSLLKVENVPKLTNFHGVACDDRMVKDLSDMLSCAKKDKINLNLINGYISKDETDKLYEKTVSDLMKNKGLTMVCAEDMAKKEIATLRDCESGLTVKITKDQLDSDDFFKTDEHHWLAKNCYSFGFVPRTPQNKEGKTGLAFDATMYRYVGRENAEKMKILNMCLEEFSKYKKIEKKRALSA